MAKYEEDDIATFYFIVFEPDNYRDENTIVAWSDDKRMAEVYMEFHHCDKLKLKKKTDYLYRITEILNENIHDEINIYNININDPKKPGRVKSIQIPATETEFRFINEETNTFLSSRICYSYINEAFPYLKNKYQKALTNIFLYDVMKKVLHERGSKFIEEVQFDQLMVLFTCFSDRFGK